jgi:C4-dicarboxylate-specific signal transduction histidine kinase
MYVVAAGSPLWPDETTAVGTVALAFVTVVAILVTLMITRQDRRNSAEDSTSERKDADARLERQISASVEQLQAERQAADARLERQIAASTEQLQAERQTADARLQAEHDSLQEREQLSEAYLEAYRKLNSKK